MGTRRWLLPVFPIALLALSIQRLLCAPAPPPAVEFRGSTMGTTFSVKLAADPPAAARPEIQRAIEARLGKVDELMSTYRADSELSRFNRHGAGEPFPVSPETLEVFRIARQVSELSGGAFDVTVGPLVAAWGFGPADPLSDPPSETDLKALRARVGFERVTIDAASAALTKTRADTVCDLSAIAKGFAVDEVAVALRDLGYTDFLVEVGGEVKARGERSDGTPWRVAIEEPDSGARNVHTVILLRDLAMATSGDYRNYYELGGKRISHTIDPRTGRPIEHVLASVSVLDPEAVRADALATALNVLGPDAGFALARREGLAAYFIVREERGGFRSRATEAFERLRAAAGEGDAR